MVIRRAGSDGGFAALELAIMSSFVLVMLLLVVGLGRVSHGRQLVEQAGSAAARAAALGNAPGQAMIDAQQAAVETLSQAGMACGQLQVNVDTAAFHPGGYVAVDLTCTIDLAGLTLAGLPGSVTMTSRSRAPLETYRDFNGVPQ
jgi:Flp pilus assembly protein TadG